MKALILMSAFLAGLWFSACKTTPEPSIPVPQQPETKETAETRPPPSTETRQSDQAGAQQESKTSQTTRPETRESDQAGAQPESKTSRSTGSEATEPLKQSPTKKAQTEPAASEDAGESTSPEAAQKSEGRQSKAAPTAESKLAKAREDLRVSQATEKKIADKLEALKKSGTASAEDIRNYEIYHERVRDMVAENRKRVEKMESAYSKHTPDGKASEAPAGSGLSGSDKTIPEEQTQDQVAELDRQLTASLNQFDALLLKEMETIETQSAAKMRDLAQEAAEAAKRLKEKGVDLGTSESESSDEASDQEKAGEKEESTKENDTSAEQGDVDETVASGNRPKGQGPGPKDDRGGRYSKEDDDIVARQLREAAENETDPELKEKLWKEYEDYKKNTQ